LSHTAGAACAGKQGAGSGRIRISSAPPGAHRPLTSLGWTAKPEVAGAERTG
jgi:hypothetical protein